MDRVPADEEVRVVHPVGEVPGDPRVHLEVAEDRRGRGLAGADRVDQVDPRAVNQRQDLQRKVSLGVAAVMREAHLEGPESVEQEAGGAAVERLGGARAKQSVVGVDRKAGALVVDAGLGNVEVKRSEALLNQLNEPASRSEAN